MTVDAQSRTRAEWKRYIVEHDIPGYSGVERESVLAKDADDAIERVVARQPWRRFSFVKAWPEHG